MLWLSRSALLVSIGLVACATTPPPAPPAPPVAAPVATPPPPVAVKATRVRSVEGITEYTLPNGLVVLLFPDATQSTVTVNVTYLVGSRHEGYGETGMAHLLEHMLFKGTQRHRDISSLLEARGGQNNGSTWTDRTNYYETLPAQGDNLEWALAMEADRMIHSTILPEDLATEFSVVRNELEMGENEPLAVLQQRIVASAYLWHNYGKDTIGSRSDVENVPVPALRAFYEKYYQPDNAVLIVSGKFDEAPTLAQIETTFGAIPRPQRVLAPSYTVEPQQDGERTVTLRRNGDIYATGVAYHTVGAASPDYPAVQAALDLLDREPSGRLYKKLVTTQLASSISGGQDMFRDPYLAVMVAEVRDGKNLERVEKAMVDELEQLGSSKIDERDVERWKLATLKQLELSFADSQEIAVELSEFAALGDWRAVFAYRDRVQQVTAADVARVAKMYFKPSNRTSGRFIPTKNADRAPLTQTPDIAAAVKDIQDRPVKDPGETFAATLSNIEARTQRSVLPSGIKAAVLPKKTRGAKVIAMLSLHWGDEASLQNKHLVGELLVDLLQRGTTQQSYQQLQDAQDRLKASIMIAGSPAGLVVRIETLRDQLPGALDLVAEILRKPAFPAAQLALIKQDWIASLEQSLQDPATVAYTELARATTPWPASDPRYPMTVAEKIATVKKLSLGELKAFYRDFVGAAHAELAIVGDTDAAAITAQVDKLFGGWTAKKPYARLADKVFGVPGAQKTIDIKDKEMSQIALSHDITMKDADPDYPAWLIVGQLLGGDSGSRVWQRLREKEGLSYGSGAWTFAGTLDDAGGFSASAIVAPQNVAKAKAAILDEVTKLVTGSVTAAEVAHAKNAWVKGLDTNLSSDSYLVVMLTQQLYSGRTTQFTEALRAKVLALGERDVERVARAYLQPGKLVVIDAGDTAKAK